MMTQGRWTSGTPARTETIEECVAGSDEFWSSRDASWLRIADGPARSRASQPANT